MRISLRQKKLLRNAFLHIFLIVATFFILFPFFWMLRTSFTPEREMFVVPLHYLPTNPTLNHYIQLPQVSPVFRLFLNSSIVAISTAIIALLIAIFAGYGFTRLRFRGTDQLLLLILVANMIPTCLLVIPYYILQRDLHIINTYQGLIIAYVAYTLPFATWMLTGYFRSIPRDLEDAAFTDGCTRIEALFKVVLPLAAPGIIAAAIFAFITGWTEFLLAYTLMSGEHMQTATGGLALMITRFSIEWGLVSAMSVLIVIPVLVLFAFLQKYLVVGLTRGAVKG